MDKSLIAINNIRDLCEYDNDAEMIKELLDVLGKREVSVGYGLYILDKTKNAMLECTVLHKEYTSKKPKNKE
ncbi:MAG: hypothetical protein N4A48_03960 [Tepidibacter sp.]|uniref:hypothetical protein n=1 Tax=Tepidibacter sp. TaxID=2529387 RepID=UPI0025F4A1C3|nr:hypothetical protein [Tepidibacter sp.]MCT4507904.1 hypothetical protein [Tepidibacter sp.]MCT4606879.1 hypothetical protein [Marinisporobacter sp.]